MKLLRRNKLVFGVGVNDADYNVCVTGVVDGRKKILSVCPFYTKWRSMLERAFSKKFHNRNPAYIGTEVCEDWLIFSNFKAWMETQDWRGKHLDKDLLVRGNRVYSEETCIFVDQKVNCFCLESGAIRGDYPLGVSKRKGLYEARCCSVETGKQQSLGYYKTPDEAHQAWLTFKIGQARLLAAEQTNPIVADALIRRYENYN